MWEDPYELFEHIEKGMMFMADAVEQLQQDFADYQAKITSALTNLQTTVKALQDSNTADQAIVAQLDAQVKAASDVAVAADPGAPVATPPPTPAAAPAPAPADPTAAPAVTGDPGTGPAAPSPDVTALPTAVPPA